MAELLARCTTGAQDRTIASPFGEVPVSAFARYVAFDGLVHGWDLAMATGLPYEPPEAWSPRSTPSLGSCCSRRCATATRSPTTSSRPPGATPLERLVAFTGRQLHFTYAKETTAMTLTLTPEDIDAIKGSQQATWASGDYAVIGTTLQIVGESLCEAVDLPPDGGSSTSPPATATRHLRPLAAACAVTATDYVAELLEGAKRRADAEGLPLTTQCRRRREPALRRRLLRRRAVDVRRHVRARPERPRRRCCGSPARRSHRSRQLDAERLHRPDVQDRRARTCPRRPASRRRCSGAPTPVSTSCSAATPGHVTRRHFVFRYRSAEHFFDTFTTYYGPTLKAWGALDDAGRESFRSQLTALPTSTTATDGALAVPSEYLEVVAHRNS